MSRCDDDLKLVCYYNFETFMKIDDSYTKSEELTFDEFLEALGRLAWCQRNQQQKKREDIRREKQELEEKVKAKPRRSRFSALHPVRRSTVGAGRSAPGLSRPSINPKSRPRMMHRGTMKSYFENSGEFNTYLKWLLTKIEQKLKERVI